MVAFSLLRLTAAAALLLPLAAHAHHPPAGEPAGWSSWNFEPWVVLLLLASAALYALGVRRLWRRAGAGRGIARGEAARFAAGWAALAAALVSPIDVLGGALFSMHMVQHELLMVVAAPLLVGARPLEAWAWALHPRWRRLAGGLFHTRSWLRFWEALTDPLAAWILHAVALWAWHVPAFFEAALGSEAMHAMQHASFFATALLFWWTVLGHGLRHAGGAALASVFTTMLHTGGLGALLTFAPTPWYVHYLDASAYGLSPLEDQQLGGLVMWVPGGLAYLAAGLAIVGAWLARPAHAAPLR